MHEVSHRAKNRLGLVQAGAAQEPEDFIGRFNERLRAFRNQSGPAGPQRLGVDIEALASAQFAHFADVGLGSLSTVQAALNLTAARALGPARTCERCRQIRRVVGWHVRRVDMRWRLEGDTFMMRWAKRNGAGASLRTSFQSCGQASAAMMPATRVRRAPSAGILPMRKVAGSTYLCIDAARPGGASWYSSLRSGGGRSAGRAGSSPKDVGKSRLRTACCSCLRTDWRMKSQYIELQRIILANLRKMHLSERVATERKR
jgi:hypothetical protein